MIISFTRASRCARCRRSTRDEPMAMAEISLRWVKIRFRICSRCYDEIAEKIR